VYGDLYGAAVDPEKEKAGELGSPALTVADRS